MTLWKKKKLLSDIFAHVKMGFLCYGKLLTKTAEKDLTKFITRSDTNSSS